MKKPEKNTVGLWMVRVSELAIAAAAEGRVLGREFGSGVP